MTMTIISGVTLGLRICKHKNSKTPNLNLGPVDGSVWNRAAIGKLVWWIVCKADHLLVRWVDSIYLKGTDWLQYQPKSDANWYWKRICETKEVLKSGIVNGKWNDPSGQYTIAKGYEFLKGATPSVRWHWGVWNRYAVPKHSFICWLYCHDRLLTMDRIKKWEPISDTNCYLCQQEEESHGHLFFKCQFSRMCLMVFSDWIGINCPSDRTLIWCSRVKTPTLLQKYILVTGVLGLIYGIWMVRNKCRLELCVKHPNAVFNDVKKQLGQRLKMFEGKMRQCDANWCQLRGLI